MKPIMIAVLLTACVPKPEIRYVPAMCPSVPQCVRPDVKLETNADLARAYTETDAAFNVCKIARDTLQQCLDKQK